MLSIDLFSRQNRGEICLNPIWVKNDGRFGESPNGRWKFFRRKDFGALCFGFLVKPSTEG
jgi:hypothetical protein